MNKSRVASIDILRGIVMVIMALDHVRDFVHQQVTPDGQNFADPTNLATTTPFLFFTRFITHYCAPTFVLLTGTSVFLVAQRKPKAELAAFLIKRGIWLVFVDLVIMSFIITFNPLYNFLVMQVIWAIGWSMILLGLMIRLPLAVIFIAGLILFFGHNALDLVNMPESVRKSPLGMILYYSYDVVIPLGSNRYAFVMYALIPWMGVMLLGYCLGRLFLPGVHPGERRKWLLRIGGGLLLFFFVFRYFNGYGDQNPWSAQPRGDIYTVLSFFNVTKYPASLLFYSVTLGCSLLALALLEKVNNRFTAVMNVYGRVPFFYYILHFLAAHLIAVLLFFIQGYGMDDIIPKEGMPLLFRPMTMGIPLWGVYLVWIALVAALYPLCVWYDRYKSTKGHWWLSYL